MAEIIIIQKYTICPHELILAMIFLSNINTSNEHGRIYGFSKKTKE